MTDKIIDIFRGCAFRDAPLNRTTIELFGCTFEQAANDTVYVMSWNLRDEFTAFLNPRIGEICSNAEAVTWNEVLTPLGLAHVMATVSTPSS